MNASKVNKIVTSPLMLVNAASAFTFPHDIASSGGAPLKLPDSGDDVVM